MLHSEAMLLEFRAIGKMKRAARTARTESLEPRRWRAAAVVGAAARWGGAVLLTLSLGGSVRAQAPADENALAEALATIYEVASRLETYEPVETEETRAAQAGEACGRIPSPFAWAVCTTSAAIVLDLGADVIADWPITAGEEMNRARQEVLQRLVALEAGQVQVDERLTREACGRISSPFARAVCTASAAIVLNLGADVITNWPNRARRDVLQRLDALEREQIQVGARLTEVDERVTETLGADVIADVIANWPITADEEMNRAHQEVLRRLDALKEGQARLNERLTEVDEKLTATDTKLDLVIQLLMRAPRQ